MKILYFARDVDKPENVTVEVQCDEAEEQLLITDLMRRQAGEAVVEAKPEKRKYRKAVWSRARREAAAERMRQTQAKLKGEREDDHPVPSVKKKPSTMLRSDDEERMRKFREKEAL